MTLSDSKGSKDTHLVRSLAALMIGTLVLRAAAGAMGENIQFYFAFIDEAARTPGHPLRTVAGAAVQAIPYTLMGIIVASFFAAELIGSPVFGAWSDKYGRKLFIILGPLFGALAVQITAMTTVIWLLVATRLLEGLSTASNAPASLGYIAEATADSPNLRSRIVGFFEIATFGGFAVGASVGGWLWRHYGHPAIVLGIPLTSPAFALNAILYIASLLILWFGLSEVPNRKPAAQGTSTKETLRHYLGIVTNPRVASFAPAWIAINAVLGVFINLTARVLTERGRFPGQLLAGAFDSFQAGNIRAAYAIVFVVGILVWSMFSGHMRKTVVMLIGTGGLFLTCAAMYLVNHQPSLESPLVMPLALILVITILIQSGFTPAALAHLADISEDHAADRGAIMGLYSVFLGIGQLIGASIGGPFIDHSGADGVVAVTALLGLVSAVLLIRLHVVERGHRSPSTSGPNVAALYQDRI